MRLRNPIAAAALACAAAAGPIAPGGASAQSAAPGQDAPTAPRPLEVTVRGAPAQPPPPAPDAAENERMMELYRAHFGGQLTRASFLGVSTSPVPAALRQHLALQEGVGLVVDFVEDDSPARSAGLRQYDILTKFNDQILVNAQQLAVLVRAHKPGDEVKLTLIRGAKEQTVTAKLVEKEVKPLDETVFWNGPGALSLNARRVTDGTPRRHESHDLARSENRTMAVWREGDTTLTIFRNPGGRRQLLVKEKDRSTLYDLEDSKGRATIPPHLADKVRRMEAQAKPDGPSAEPDVREERTRTENNNDNNDDSGDDGKDPEGDDQKGDQRRSNASPIGRDDLLTIEIVNVHGPGVHTEKTARVRDGRLRLPYVKPVEVEGLTESELEERIITLYGEARIAPQVEVTVKKVAPARKHDKHEGPPF